VFDVGHQSYVHKLLTGRFDRFDTLRQKDGLSGFMRPDESEHDAFVSGHSSNSISAAYGIYKAKQMLGSSGTAVAVIGDGAMTGGMAYEALNNAGNDGRSNFIVVLNDNKMSISRNVGAISRAFTRLRNRPRYHQFKFAFGRFLVKIPLVGRPLFRFFERCKNMLKSIVYRNNIFSALGYHYLGPVDGHDIAAMETLFRAAKQTNRSALIHVITTKGKGYSYAEEKPKSYHGVSPFDMTVGAQPSGKVTYSDVAGKTLCELADKNDKICAITAAMTEGTGLHDFAEQYKNRFFDVGIAEQHAVTFAAGLAKGGMLPFFAVYSSFLQRGYDQIIHDIAIGRLPVKLLVDRAGIVGEDGESHQGLFDAAYLSTVPGMNVYAPATYQELRDRIVETSQNEEISAIRYPRGCAVDSTLCFDGDYTLIGGDKKRAIVTYGRLFFETQKAALRNTDVIKLNKIYPLCDDLTDLCRRYSRIDFFEEGIRTGGIAEQFGASLEEAGYSGKYCIHAVDNQFVPAADTATALADLGLNAAAMSYVDGVE
ncbi:MAG: 1-deoxy-D-xylulose-5-phosphate synthase, partial [Clostridia bacterium]|nr:1-deoxy-D-xylulose-5-phosphate synthase [Clostridia bacterium]